MRRRLWERVRPGPSALARIRFTFGASALVVAALALPALAFAELSAPVRLAGLAGVVWMVGRYLHLYLTERPALALVPVDTVALLAAGLGMGANPSLGLLFTNLYFRSLYGSRCYVAANTVASLAAYVLSNLLDSAAGSALPDSAFNQVLGLPLTAFVMHVVANSLHKEERTRARERRLREAGGELVAATDRDAVHRAGLAAALSLLPSPAGARVAIWRHEGDQLRAVAAAGDRSEDVLGQVLPVAAVPEGQRRALYAGNVVRVLPNESEAPRLPFPLKTGGVLIIPLRDQDDLLGAMVTSSDVALPTEVDDALRALGSQVALALESVELAEDLHRRQSEDRLAALVRNASDVITVVDEDSAIAYQTPSMQRVFGHAPERLVGTPVLALVHPDDQPAARAFLARAGQRGGEAAGCEWRLAHADGAWRDVEVTASNLLSDPNVRGIVLTSRDVTERKALEGRLAHQAFHDPLTGLANRDLFRDRVGHALARARARGTRLAAVLFVDVDDFKNVNDTLGHAAGDRLLGVVAERLGACVRAGDTSARLGGDEFALLLEDLQEASDADACAQRVLCAFNAAVELGDRQVKISASVGVALAQPGADVDELLRDADIAMYAAKREGKKRYRRFEPEMFALTRDRVELHEDLAVAVERDELRVHYQPVVDLVDERVLGVEALLRWEHPRRGLLHPGEFIALAEETGLIAPLGRWVLREGCRQLAAWRAEHPAAAGLKLSVNLAAAQLSDPELIAHVRACLEAFDLAPGSLTMEITESAVIEDVERAVSRLQALAELGVGLAIDDFGTGYSSLSYLQRFPLDTLKLDKSFTDHVAERREQSRLARGIVELGHTLGLDVIAEGVERREQVDSLLASGCRQGQGFLFARPLAPEALLALLEARGVAAQRQGPPLLATLASDR